MSLLNDMLRDISQRHQVQDGAYDDSLLKATSFARAKPNTWLGAALIFISVFVVVCALNYCWHHYVKHTTDLTAPSAASAAPLAVVAEKTNKPSANANRSSIPAVTPLVVTKIDVELQARIDELLRQAERATSMDRLTSPIEDNAYGYYQKILTLSPNNEQALQGLDDIAARYLAKAQEQQQLGNTQQMEALIQRAKFVAPDFVRDQVGVRLAPDVNLPVENGVQDLGSAQNANVGSGQVQTVNDSEAPPAIHESIKSFKVTEAPHSEIDSQETINSQQLAPEQEQEPELARKPESTRKLETNPKLEVTPNAGWQDQQLAQQARELMQQGKSPQAITLLKNFIVTEPAPQRSTSLLLDIYLQQGNDAAAEILLAHATYLPAVSIARYKALILSARGDNAGAISLLEKNLSAAEADEDYRALLASLYHKTGNYSQSVLSYQRMLRSFGDKPAYWLGLALAYDGLSQPADALQAYTHLREFAQLQPQVSTYIDQRIAALRSQ